MKVKKEKKRHVYEEQYPQQCKEYKKIVAEKYQLFLNKGREYGVNNVRALGLLGLSLRLAEKIIRILNIQGWDLFAGKFTKIVENPKYGSIERELQDIANLAIIAIIKIRGKWAK